MAAYYNEIDAYAAQWLRNLAAAGLIAPGDVDERSIVDVQPDDLIGYTQCHFFAGIGGWSYAARLAGWPDERELWTGSCPCQPWSRAGRSEGRDSNHHLWPIWRELILSKKPPVVMGEQVPTSAGRGWWDEVAEDMEAAGYACGAIIASASGVGAHHDRERLWFVAHAAGERDRVETGQIPPGRHVIEYSDWWASEPDVGRVAHGVPARVGKLRAYGNAIVPQVAAEVIAAYLE
ncbi:MAG: DNA cytosine methyltransferase, partial [Dehalococcoidia bacterium]